MVLPTALENETKSQTRGLVKQLMPIDPNDSVSLAPYLQDLPQIDPLPWCGEVTATVGLLIESQGPAVAIGDFCEIFTAGGGRIRTQVIGFRNGRVLAMPLDEPDGLQLGSRLRSRGRGFSLARFRGWMRGRRSEGEQQVVTGAALLHSVGSDRDQTGVAGSAQIGENLSVG